MKRIMTILLHPVKSIFGIQQALFVGLVLLIASAVKGCFPLMSPAGGCGGGVGGGCCMGGGGCGDVGGGAVPYPAPGPPYVYPAYPAQQSVPYAAKSRSMAMASSSATRTAPASASMDAGASCARRYTDTRLSCALPFERRTPSDESECQRHCSNAVPRCRSFQFDPAGSVCDLFEHSLGPSSFSTSSSRQRTKASQQQQHRRRRRFFLQSGVPLDRQSQQMRTTAAAGVNTLAHNAPSSPLSSASHCVPTLETLAGSVFVGFDAACSAAAQSPPDDPFLSTDDQNGESTERIVDDDTNQVPIPLPPPPPPVPTAPTVRKYASGESLVPFHTSTVPSLLGHKYDRKGGNYGGTSHRERVETDYDGLSSQVETLSSPADTNSVDCAVDGARARVMLIDGIALTGQIAIAHVQLSSADVCLHVCRQNVLLDGHRLPLPCRSATFHRQNGRCEFLATSISPNGALQYVPNPDSLYFEKICIPRNELAPGCDDVIHRIPQHHLDPRRTTDGGTVLTATSQLDCVRKCISAKTQLGFNCVSASFFFDSPAQQNCYLSRFTRLSRPDLYAAERRELVDYMEMPPCFQLPARVRLHDVPTEAPPGPSAAWSACIGGIRWRAVKNCTKNGTQQSEDEQCVEREFCGRKSNAGTTGKNCGGEKNKCGDGNDAQKGGIASIKSVAPNFEVAKRFNGPAVASEEASLFGEQDYDNQKEVSFFGPPHSANANDGDHSEESEGATVKASDQQCDPMQKCCPIETAKGMVRGCSLGKRTLADGHTTVSCVPDECQ